MERHGKSIGLLRTQQDVRGSPSRCHLATHLMSGYRLKNNLHVLFRSWLQIDRPGSTDVRSTRIENGRIRNFLSIAKSLDCSVRPQVITSRGETEDPKLACFVRLRTVDGLGLTA